MADTSVNLLVIETPSPAREVEVIRAGLWGGAELGTSNQELLEIISKVWKRKLLLASEINLY